MHTFVPPNENTWFHNGDFSGDVSVLVHCSKVEIQGALAKVEIPFEDVLALVHKYQAMQSEQAMEDAAAKDGFPSEEICSYCRWAFRRLGHHNSCRAEDPVRPTAVCLTSQDPEICEHEGCVNPPASTELTKEAFMEIHYGSQGGKPYQGEQVVAEDAEYDRMMESGEHDPTRRISVGEASIRVVKSPLGQFHGTVDDDQKPETD